MLAGGTTFVAVWGIDCGSTDPAASSAVTTRIDSRAVLVAADFWAALGS